MRFSMSLRSVSQGSAQLQLKVNLTMPKSGLLAGSAWRRRVLPCLVGASLLLSGCSLWRTDDEAPEEPVVVGESDPGQVIDPGIERRGITVPQIDSEVFEVGAFLGTLATTRDNTVPIGGIRAGRFFNPDFFTEITVADSFGGENDTTGPERGDDVSVSTLDITLGYNLFPMEIFTGEDKVYPAWIYVLAGAGAVDYADDTFLGAHFGVGIRVMPVDHWSVRVEMRNQLWPSVADEPSSANLQFTFGVGYGFGLDP